MNATGRQLLVGTALVMGLAGLVWADDTTTVSKLSDIPDGETRIYGTGDHQVSALRDGDLVTVTIPEENGDDRLLVIDISGGDGTLTTTAAEEPNAHTGRLVLVKKSLDDEGVAHEVLMANAMSTRTTVVEPAESKPMPSRAAEPLYETSGGGTVEVSGSGAHLLRCPKGDSAMRVTGGDATSYRCPKHDLVLIAAAVDPELESIVVADRAQHGEIPVSFEAKTIGGGEKKYSGKPLSLDF